MRVRTNHLRVDEGGPAAVAAILDRLAHHREAGQRIAAVDLAHEKVRERADELGDAAARRLHLDGDRDRVTVVLDEIDDGDLAIARGVEALPELAFGRGSVARRAVDDLARFLGQLHAGLGAAHRLKELRAGGGRLGHDVQAPVTPVRRHLAAARVGVVLGPHRGEEHLLCRHAQLQHERAVAVVRVEPIGGGAHGHAGGDEDGFVPRAADLEIDLVLPLELDFLVVDAPRQVHRPVDGEECLAVEPLQPVVDRLRGQRASSLSASF
jgi:hypothetical protein